MARALIQVLAPAGGEVVDHGDLVAPVHECVDEVGADETRPACDKCAHERDTLTILRDFRPLWQATMAPVWTTDPYDGAAAAALQDALGLGPAAAAILVRRGYGDAAAARAFLAADTVTDPAALPGAAAACELVLRHVEAGSRILVFGDYDVDGVCSTAMMIRTLRALGADPAWQLPSRAEGYGLGLEAVERIAGYGTALLITVDCGVTSVAEVARARELGMDVLVTDHHRPGPELPDCPVVHPALGPQGIEGPAGELCAAGVVLKLSAALYAAAGLDPARADEDLDLAGLATVCDMVPLRGENRRIARQGMAAVAATRKAGLRALMAVADLEPGDVDAQSAGLSARPADQRRRPPAARRRGPGADAHRGLRARGPDRARAGRAQPRPARDRAAHPARGRGAVRAAAARRRAGGGR